MSIYRFKHFGSLFGLITGSPFKFRVGPPEEGDADILDTVPGGVEEGADDDDIGRTCSFYYIY